MVTLDYPSKYAGTLGGAQEAAASEIGSRKNLEGHMAKARMENVRQGLSKTIVGTERPVAEGGRGSIHQPRQG